MNKQDEYWKLAESEKHFNEIQSGIRNLAPGWMLAAFAAIALLLKIDNKNVRWLVPPAVLVGAVGFMATLGLLVLWINDQLVYPRLPDCGFIIALKMEYDDPHLPPIRALMMHAAEGKGMCRWMTYFYTIPMWVFLAITIAATLLRQSLGGTSQTVSRNQFLAILVILGVAQLYATVWVHGKKAEVGAPACASLFKPGGVRRPVREHSGRARASRQRDGEIQTSTGAEGETGEYLSTWLRV